MRFARRRLSSHWLAPPACTTTVTLSGISAAHISYRSFTQSLCKSVPHMYIRMVIVGVSAYAAGSPSSTTQHVSSSARSRCFTCFFASFLILWYNSAIFIVVLQIPAVNRDSRIKKRP